MRKLILVAAMCITALYCHAQAGNKYNLDFEKINNNTHLPAGWGMGTIQDSSLPKDNTIAAYQIDSITKHDGRYAMLIDWTKGYSEWTSNAYVIRKIFNGHKIKLTGYVKTENVTGTGVGLWMRLDGVNYYKNYGFDNMQDRPIKGTTDWKEYTIEMDYAPANVASIVVGGLIEGTGKMWMDNLRISIDGTDITELTPMTEEQAHPEAKYNLNFEKISSRTGLPAGWGMGTVRDSSVPVDRSAEAFKLDSVVRAEGRYSLLVDWKGDYDKTWTSTAYAIHKAFKGDKIKLTGYVKTENVTGKGAGLWMRLDGRNYENYGFDNMQDRPINGTTDWQEYSIEMDYDEDNVKSIVVGGLIEGTGKMWMDDLHITIDGKDIAEVPINLNATKGGGAERSKYITDDALKITMRDGAQMSAIMVRKRAVTGPLPVVLMFDIYPGANNTKLAKECAAHGYVGIIADTRGKRLSKEDIEPFEHDANDAYDIIGWISKQSWCNGKVGMYGGSYLGFSQWAAVKKVHPALKTIVPQVAVGPGIDFPASFGVFSCYALRWLHYVMNNKLTDYEEFSNTEKWNGVFNKWYTSGRAFNTLDTIEGRPNKIFHRWLQHPSYDQYWNSMVPYQKEFANIHIPVLTISGYWDADQRGAMYYYNQHRLYDAANNDYLVMGPYDHGGAQGHPERVLNGYTIDPAAAIDIKELVFQWFDYVMNDSAKPALLKDKINFEVMGADHWRHVPSFEQMNNDTVTFYLSNIQEGSAYKLLLAPDINSKPISQQIDLADRNDSGKNDEHETLTDTTFEPGKYLKFRTDPLTEPITINGSFIASLNTIINKKDMDITVGLCEQLPNGKYLMLSNNIERCSYIKDHGKRQLLKPGKTENILLNNTFFTSIVIGKGSRIVVLIGINKNRNYEINYGTGNDVSTETIKDGKTPLDVQWLTNGSYIKLPVFKE